MVYLARVKINPKLCGVSQIKMDPNPVYRAISRKNLAELKRCFSIEHWEPVAVVTSMTPLGFATLCGWVEGMRYLILEQKQDVNRCDRSGRTPIFYAINIETIDVLVENGANVNAQMASTGATALHEVQDDFWLARSLVHRGADPEMRDARGRTAYDCMNTDLVCRVRRGRENYLEDLAEGRRPFQTHRVPPTKV